MDGYCHGLKSLKNRHSIEKKSKTNRSLFRCDDAVSWIERLSSSLLKYFRKKHSILSAHVLSILILACVSSFVSAEQSHVSVAQINNNPAIEVTKKDNVISMSAEQADLRDVFAVLSEISSTPITVVDLDRKNEISISFKGKTLADALKLLKKRLPAGGLAVVNAESQPGAAGDINNVYVLVKKGRAGAVGDVRKC